jgi:hypothetical protein
MAAQCRAYDLLAVWRRLFQIRGMLSVLIETKNDEEALARTLASLVSAAVEGVVREVIICDLGSSDQSNLVAEQAGCHFLGTGGIAAGIKQAKGDWLLLLEPGARLQDGWMQAVLDHTEMMKMPGRFARAKADRPRFLAKVFSSNRALRDGLLIRKAQAAALAHHAKSAEAIARGLATKRLPAEIRVAPPL